MKKTIVIMLALCSAAGVMADVFHGTTFNGQDGTDMVGIGFAGNSDDTTGYGGVGYNYYIGKTEVSADQFAASGVGSGNEGTGGSPAIRVSLYEARKYCNWLTTQAGGSTLAYSADGKSVMNDHTTLAAGSQLTYVVASEDEWYKAAYFKAGNDLDPYSLYSTGNDTVPSTSDFNYGGGSVANVGDSILEQNGTQDMMGNMWEWNDDSGFRGGTYSRVESFLRSSFSYNVNPTGEYDTVGFRIAAIPEPSSIAILGVAGGCLLGIRRMFMM